MAPVAGQLVHRCIVERDASSSASPHRDPYRQRSPVWEVAATDVPCRLVTKQQRVVDTVTAEAAVVTVYLLLTLPDAPIVPTRSRVRAVTDRAGRPIAPGPFSVESRLVRTGHAGARAHTSYQLELQGGAHGPDPA